jgi:Ala-tRNA(Pro) deacylase
MGLAITLAQYLLDRGVAYDLVPHPHTETARASAATSGVPADNVVKSVVLKAGHGFLLALLPASRHINFDQLSRLLGTEVDIAGEEQIEPLFVDCEPGSVPALGAPYGLDVVVDDSLDRQRELYLEGGDHSHLVHVSGASFRELMQHARHGHFTSQS